MDYMKLNGMRIPYPNNFEMKPKINKVALITTLSGDEYADVNGWKYQPITMQWDTLFDEDLNNLLAIANSDTFMMTFIDLDGQEHTETAVFESRVSVKTPLKRNGKIVWSGISVEVSFPKCHRD